MPLETLIPLHRPISQAVYEASSRMIPGGVNSPVRSFSNLMQTPLVIESGEKEMVADVDGYRYIDYCGSWGALIHGHAHPEIVQAAQERTARGSTFGTATPIEKALAERVLSYFPSMEKIRFVSSGTEAAMSAIRLARGFTGRDLIVKFSGNYHGHADSLLMQGGSGLMTFRTAASSAGIPEDFIRHTVSLPYNDQEAATSFILQNPVAAVIVEPIAANMGVVCPREGFLESLREAAGKTGALLIFDEVITGFRVARGGAQQLFGIEPDLTCLGKIVGGGFPAAAFGGKKKIMDCLAPEGSVYQAGTLSGNPVAMAAGLKALQLLEREDFYSDLEEKTAVIVNPVQALLKRKKIHACVQHIGSMFTFFFGAQKVDAMEARLDRERFRAFFHYLFQRGIYCAPSQYEANFISDAHRYENLEYTRDVILEFFA